MLLAFRPIGYYSKTIAVIMIPGIEAAENFSLVPNSPTWCRNAVARLAEGHVLDLFSMFFADVYTVFALPHLFH